MRVPQYVSGIEGGGGGGGGVVVSVPLRQEWRMWRGVGGYVRVVGCGWWVYVVYVCVLGKGGGGYVVCVELVLMKQVSQFAGVSTAVVVNVVVMMCGSCGECGGDDVWQLR